MLNQPNRLAVDSVGWFVVFVYLQSILRLTGKRTVALNGINLKQLSTDLLRCEGLLGFNISAAGPKEIAVNGQNFASILWDPLNPK